jgi:hypothetical protein
MATRKARWRGSHPSVELKNYSGEDTFVCHKTGCRRKRRDARVTVEERGALDARKTLTLLHGKARIQVPFPKYGSLRVSTARYFPARARCLRSRQGDVGQLLCGFYYLRHSAALAWGAVFYAQLSLLGTHSTPVVGRSIFRCRRRDRPEQALLDRLLPI